MSEPTAVEPPAEADIGSVAYFERRLDESIKQSPAYKALVAEIEKLKKVNQRQRDDHTMLWNWVKAIEQRLIRAERSEPPTPAVKGDGE